MSVKKYYKSDQRFDATFPVGLKQRLLKRMTDEGFTNLTQFVVYILTNYLRRKK